MDVETLDRWAAPAIALGGGIAVSVWSIYWDYRRRFDPESRPADARAGTPARRGRAARIRDPLGLGGALAAAGAACRIFAGDQRFWLAALGYGSGIAGVAFLAVYLFRRCEARVRGTGEES